MSYSAPCSPNTDKRNGQQFREGTVLESGRSTEKRFQMEVFDHVADIVVSQIQHRLSKITKVVEPFLFLLLAKLVSRSNNELQPVCTALGTLHNADINSEELFSGICSARRVLQGQAPLPNMTLAGDVICCLLESQLSDDVYPNLSTALRHFLVVPVTLT